MQDQMISTKPDQKISPKPLQFQVKKQNSNDKDLIVDRGVLFMKRLEQDGHLIRMKDQDRDMIQVFTDGTQLQGVKDVERAIVEDDLELKVCDELSEGKR